MMGMAIPFAYFLILSETSRLKKILFALAIPVFLGATVAADNASKGGFIGICVAFLYCLARSPRKGLTLGTAAVVALLVLGSAGPKYWEEIASITETESGTADDRKELWTIGMRMFAANPVFGVGPSSFRWTIGEYQSDEQREKYGRDLGGTKVAHSLFVELFAEMGLTGAVVLGALVWRTWRDLRRVERGEPGRHEARPPDAEQLRLGRYADAATGSILACLVNGLFLSLLYFSYLYFLVALAGAVAQVSRARMAAPGPA
jgi:O-antigen ligase